MNITSKKAKIALAVATIFPIAYIIFFMLFMLAGMFGIVFSAGSGMAPAVFPASFAVIFVLHMFVMLLNVALLAFYIIHAIKNTTLTSEMRIIWIILIVFMGMIAFPVYWYMYIWKEGI